MQKIFALIILAGILVILGCESKSVIDMEKMEKTFREKDNRGQYMEEAKKSIFPNMK